MEVPLLVVRACQFVFNPWWRGGGVILHLAEHFEEFLSKLATLGPKMCFRIQNNPPSNLEDFWSSTDS